MSMNIIKRKYARKFYVLLYEDVLFMYSLCIFE